ncbi:histidinol-phosphate transaminase [Gramella lutea]|uniref:Histidinol-phosphate aminotransferase n=1 Tax=Christiangramia lutea TaxID=1607951 RepID=A0A9X1V344_9FLAO|nr:histidinol-phosphate transaminase [Christiangramia lutea]MCH4823234.1 histidinol-phosphate transaminase [Christiangramia lutea]
MKKFDLTKLVRSNVAVLKPYSSARDEFKTQGKEMIFLDANENPNDNGLNRYPDPQQGEVKAKLSELKGLPEKNILLGNGSDEVLDLVFRAFCEPGNDNIITLPPTYGMYKVLADINNIENKEVLLNEDFEPDVPKILNAADENTRIIFLCSPNNPSGNSFDEDKISSILDTFNGLVVIDEAYIDFSENESWVQKLEFFPNLIVTQTFSKAFGLAGIRLGMLFASEEIITVLNKIKPPYNVNQQTQDQALKRLSDSKEVKRQISDIVNEKNYLLEQLLQVDFVSKIYPSDANFLLLKVDDANRRYDDFINKGIVLRNRSTQPLCENCLRITVGTKKENAQLIKAFKDLDNE